ncbi:DUF1524 domain-containing protein [Phycicoccus sp. Root101]|uniref:GmrSD restriction endonuclease domain-containing protein n=1 Tax=Phycicoccus sp. Root101 TaxID=1736421 RepID=UPI0009EBC5BD|nr:DUF1524 domain-containing protein [Phycicoccus sp. Root101]
MIRRPELRWPAAAGWVLLVVAVSGCVPANADSPAFSTLTGPTSSTGSTPPGEEAQPASAPAPTTTTTPTTNPARSATTDTSRPAASTTPAPDAATATVRPGTAVTTLATLPVKGRAPRTGYDRDRFGQAWADVDRNGCDTRNDILRRDLTRFTLKAGTNGCLVLAGTLADPYTGTAIDFVRGRGTSNAVQIDHVVALSDAWQKGAQQWSTAKRTAFANDPLNLLAVDGPTNAGKGDGDAATWLPPRKAGRCSYVARQVAVKHRYGLWVTAAERDAVIRVLRACPGQALPTARAIPLGGGPTGATPTPTPTPARSRSTPKPSTPKPSHTDPRFGTCREANAAGYGPYRQGVDPEYDWYQDRDHDGLACER